MQIIKYEANKNILTVGFKDIDTSENNFVVYTQIPVDSTKAKQELLQRAYKQCKNSIDYEKTQTEHNLTTDETGDEFTPEVSKLTKLQIDFENLKGVALDQYGDIVSTEIVFTVEGTDKAVIKDGKIVEQLVAADTEYNIVATYESLAEKQKKVIYAPKVIPTQVSETDKQVANFILDTTNRLDTIEKKINGGA